MDDNDAAALERIRQGSRIYSKAAFTWTLPEGFQPDSQSKQERASPEVKQAAQTYLQPSYEALEQLAQQAKQILATMEATSR